MRVHTLIVINISDEFSDSTTQSEDRNAALAIYKKCTEREIHRPLESCLIELDGSKETGEFGASQEASLVIDKHFRLVQGKIPADFDNPDVGVYLIFHAKKSSSPNIFGVQSLGKADNNNVQASRLVGCLEKLGIRSMRKLSLVACNVTNHRTQSSKNFLVAVAKRLGNWDKKCRPMIAGYDEYVYVRKDGRKSKDPGGTEAMKGAGHKQVWVIKGLLAGYANVSLEQSGWSDKGVEQTNIGVAALTN